MNIASRYASGRLVSVLEGGYDLDALGRCVASHVATCWTTRPRRRVSVTRAASGNRQAVPSLGQTESAQKRRVTGMI